MSTAGSPHNGWQQNDKQWQRTRLRLLSIVGPLLGLAALYPLRWLMLIIWPQVIADIVTGVLMVIGVVVFSATIFQIISRQDRHLAQQHDALVQQYETERTLRTQMESLHQTALTMLIQNARLNDRVRRLAIAAERERISHDLQDGVIQTLYAVNLDLEEAIEDIASNPAAAERRIDVAIDRLSQVIKNIRRSILGMQPDDQNAPVGSLPHALARYLEGVRADTLLETNLSVTGEKLDDIPPLLAQELLYCVREAVTNVLRHGHAGMVSVTLKATADHILVRIVDNGTGFDRERLAVLTEGGFARIQDHVKAFNGTVAVESAPGQGTTIEVDIPSMALSGIEQR